MNVIQGEWIKKHKKIIVLKSDQNILTEQIRLDTLERYDTLITQVEVSTDLTSTTVNSTEQSNSSFSSSNNPFLGR